MSYKISTNNMRTLQQIMMEYNLSVRALARYINCSASLLSLMMNGKRTFKLKHKDNIAKVLNIREEIKWTNQ